MTTRKPTHPCGHVIGGPSEDGEHSSACDADIFRPLPELVCPEELPWGIWSHNEDLAKGYYDVWVIVDGAVERQDTLPNEWQMHAYLKREDTLAEQDPAKLLTEVYVSWHPHAPESTECNCAQHETDHNPRATYNGDQDEPDKLVGVAKVVAWIEEHRQQLETQRDRRPWMAGWSVEQLLVWMLDDGLSVYEDEDDGEIEEESKYITIEPPS